MIEHDQLEKIMNLTYPGLQMIHRDTTMRRPDEKYAAGILLHETRPLQGSFLGGGLLGLHRFAVLSNRIVTAQAGEYGHQWGMGSIAEGGHFKVLDMYRRLGRAQIALLHLPDEHWRVFDDLSTNVDDLLIEYVRQRFDRCVEAEPAEALKDEAWRRACVHLVGMTDLGRAYSLE